MIRKLTVIGAMLAISMTGLPSLAAVLVWKLIGGLMP